MPGSIKPRTIAQIKRLAKTIKGESKKTDSVLQHAKALDEAAKVAGYINFAHANRVLKK